MSGSVLPTVSAPHVENGFVYWVQLADSSVHDFWTNDQPEQTATIYRVPTTGGVVQSLASFNGRSDRYAMQVAFDGSYMYWAADPPGGPGETHGAIVRAALDGSNPTTILDGLFMPNGVVVVGDKIYFSVGGPASKPSAVSLQRADLDGSNVETIGQKIDVSFEPDLWTSDFAYTTDPQGIAHIATSSGQESTVVDLGWDATGGVGSPVLYALSLDGNDGLFIQSTFDPLHSPQPASLVRWSPSGGAPVTIANGLELDMNWPGLARTASDGTNAYASSAGSIVRAPLAGGALQTVGPTAAATGGIAFDDARVFWTAFDTTSFTLYAACR